jgi:predicted RNA-binding protein associated with RNAse of E/G family
VYHQTLVHEGQALVTYLPTAGVPRPVVVDGRTVLEADSPVVWLTFPGEWHDIGRFHGPDGLFTGYYANILTPVHVDGDVWDTTDLFLDLFVSPSGQVHLLDEDELAEAERLGWVDAGLARRARAEADRLARAARDGAWPPPVARSWTLDRARASAGGTRAASPVYRNRSDRES